ARKAAKNVSDHASSASIGPSIARHTRSTVGPCLLTISSKGGRVALIVVPSARERPTPDEACRRVAVRLRPTSRSGTPPTTPPDDRVGRRGGSPERIPRCPRGPVPDLRVLLPSHRNRFHAP